MQLEQAHNRGPTSHRSHDSMSVQLSMTMSLQRQEGRSSVLKEAQGSVVLNWIRMKFGFFVRQVTTPQMAESDFGHDVTLSGWRP